MTDSPSATLPALPGGAAHAPPSVPPVPPLPPVDGPAPAAPPPYEPEPLHGGTLLLGTLALSLATFMNVLDSSIANVSLPAIAGDLGVSPGLCGCSP